jgi:hypothetical protein
MAHESFDSFWLFYLREHSRPRTRALHYLGTGLVLLVAAAAVATASWWLLVLMPIAGYGFAWTAHMTVEQNRPATSPPTRSGRSSRTSGCSSFG